MPSLEPDELGAAVRRFRDLRRRFEQAIPATAISIDGRSFSYRAAAGSAVPPPGGFVALVDEGARRLGQLITQELVTRDGPAVGASVDGESLAGEGALDLRATVQVRVVEGEGVILSGDGTSFVDASLEDATGEEITKLSGPRRDATELVIGTVPTGMGDTVAARIDAAGFDRHTFLCGQSGSGKTYSLGVVLEQLLLNTGLRVVVIDPNSDFVRLRDARAEADPVAAARLAELAPSIIVRRPSAVGDDRLRLRFSELDGAAYAGILRLDPIRDSEEYDQLLRALEEGPGAAAYQAIAAADAGGDAPTEGVGRLLRRVRNLGVDRFGVWARDQAGSVLADLDRDDWRCLVVDIGTLGTTTEKMLVAQAVLSHLWERRLERRPVLVVIDEAHNVCPQLPESPLQFLATDTAIRIAAEGRKFGLYLLVSTQRPQKVHENVVSQCDNLLLMRMNSAADVGHLTKLFSFVPPSLLERATGFRQGEALVAGKIAAMPTFVRFGARITEEGGSDVPADWARPTT